MKLLAFNDLHCDAGAAERLVRLSTEVDLVIGAGDYACMHDGLDETIAMLASIATPTVLVPGNNETVADLRAALRIWPAARILHGATLEHDGFRIFGLGGVSGAKGGWSFTLSESEIAAAFAPITEADIVILHGPPRGVLDDPAGGLQGSPAVADAILRIEPALAFCGHVHARWGREERLGLTRIVNGGPGGRIIEWERSSRPA